MYHPRISKPQGIWESVLMHMVNDNYSHDMWKKSTVIGPHPLIKSTQVVQSNPPFWSSISILPSSILHHSIDLKLKQWEFKINLFFSYKSSAFIVPNWIIYLKRLKIRRVHGRGPVIVEDCTFILCGHYVWGFFVFLFSGTVNLLFSCYHW